MPETPTDVLACAPSRLAEWLQAAGQPSYRLDQLLDWVFKRHAATFDEMTNLPADVRTDLAANFHLGSAREVQRRADEEGETTKLLLRLRDGSHVEAVAMGSHRGVTFCISSQVGCALGCTFCATGAGGFRRNMSMAEVLGQVSCLARAVGAPRNVVFMGMGEPLLNLPAVLPAIEALTDEARFGLGGRRITVSTAGVTPGIRELAGAAVPPNLALSLNSPFQEERVELMPVAQRYPLDDLVEGCREYGESTGRRLLIEYVLLHNVNTSPRHAYAVARLAQKLHAFVNIIPLNPVDECPYREPARAEVHRFRETIESCNVPVGQRYRRGRGIDAACGQLRARHAVDS